MDFERVKKIIRTEAETFKISEQKIYSLALECLGYNSKLADKFMLSIHGGYDKDELNRIHQVRNKNRNHYQKVQNQACAF